MFEDLVSSFRKLLESKNRTKSRRGAGGLPNSGFQRQKGLASGCREPKEPKRYLNTLPEISSSRRGKGRLSITSRKRVTSASYGENENIAPEYAPYISELGETTSGRNVDSSTTGHNDEYISRFPDPLDISRRHELYGDSNFPDGNTEEAQATVSNKKLQKRSNACELGEEESRKEDGYIRKLENDLKEYTKAYSDIEQRLKQEAANHQNLDREHWRLRSKFNDVEQKLKDANFNLNQTSEALARLQFDYDELEQRNRNLDQQYRQDLATAEETARRDMLQMNRRLDEVRRQNEESIAAIKRQAEERERERNIEFSRTLEQRDAAHSVEKEALNNVIASQNKRIAAYSTGDYTAISDQTFSLTFQTLAQQISNLVHCVPRPDSFAINRALDPTNFLARNVQQGSRIWPKFVKSICWQIILHGFFQLPFGFGALGYQGEGHEVLFTIYQAYARPSPKDPTLLILPNEKRINVKRSGLFEEILLDIKSPLSRNQDKRFTKLFRSNVQAVERELVSTLQRICHDRLDARAPSLISSIAYEVGVLALEMGSQRANILLERCNHGDFVSGGDFFKDDNPSFGSKVQVDLMTQPCLRRIGDGREDMNIEKVIVKGDFMSIHAGY